MAEKKVTETAEVAVKEENALTFSFADFADLKAAKGEVALGMETISSEDIVMPKVKMVQSNSLEVTRDKIPAGDFYNSMTKTSTPTLDDIVILCFGHSRIRFAKPFNRNDAPLCRSVDGIKSTDGIACASCEFCKWDNLAEGATKPDCTMAYTILALPYSEDGKFGTPFRMIISGAGISEFKRTCITPVATTGMPPFIFRMSVASKQVEENGNYFYVPEFSFKKSESGQQMLINPAFKDQLKEITESWTQMMSKVNEYDTTHADEVADEEGALF